ncbi:MAG TPA: 1-deoxy-D-xylulose-5-phosphate reductoisomerase [Pusillimonas sp.]|uniref:1-deoxy-D-xylulose-5-phosphate reductoisomerase n=1 Tax=unclassified Pusillimonas TaxID=2640016 RepID=UPI00261B8B34|nr:MULTISPECIES: 1-deoxy-D-xylulose-5-phosphate reductoisomerase [unclassified Pusillimonas]HLU19781.1 1-deoxy-D-xylulose-5-phosphate reductoisomerase [Pusillimonas sp.]
MKPQRLCILGSTGSIGCSTLDVVSRHADTLQVHALTAHSRMEQLAQQAMSSGARVVAVPDDAARQRFLAAWPAQRPAPEIRVGAQALEACAADPDVDTVMAAIVGAAGLPSALAAARAGKRVLLANKEALVAAGSLFMAAVRQNGAELLPIDSEHNAIFQCLPHAGATLSSAMPARGVRRLLLTASGGPFRTVDIASLEGVTPEQACAHPNWSMGRKISVDSATMLNKGLEVIEAHWLFSMPPEQIQVVIHPQSMIHSMVEYEDGSILAQLGQPDMRTPIAYGLGFPDRIESGVGPLDLAMIGRLDFEPPDFRRFPCLKLSFQALEAGQEACIVLNAANEIAVEHFLNNRIPFTGIARVIEECLDRMSGSAARSPDSLEAVLELDASARQHAQQLCQ